VLKKSEVPDLHRADSAEPAGALARSLEAGNLPLRLPMRFPMGNWMGELAQRFCCYSGLICWGPQSVALRSHCLARG